jgi:hypothetical protein
MDNNDLYDWFRGMAEQNNRNKFNYFINGLYAGLVEDLNKAFQGDRAEYEAMLARIKSQGFRVFRNNKGEHKVEVAK